MIISEYDKSKITEVLSKQDIYHITSLPWKVAASDCGSKQIEFDTALRHKWMYSETGFFQSLDDYSNTFKLIDDYLNNGDAPYTLRQRINIVNELFDCDFKSNLPVHVSFKPRTELDSNTTINLSDDSINNYHFIFHPGQTRGQGSVFTRTNLKNSLVYVKKEHNINVKMDSDKHITKIESWEQLLKVYSPNKKVDTSNIVIQFSVTGVDGADYWNGFKKHHQHDIIILKCMHMYAPEVDMISSKKEKYHSSDDYTYNTLKSINNFYKLLSNNRFNIYSNGNSPIHIRTKQNQQNLYDIGHKASNPKNSKPFIEGNLNYPKDTAEGNNYSEVFNQGTNTQFIWDSKNYLKKNDNIFSDDESKLIKSYYEFLKSNDKLLKDIFSNSKSFMFEPNIEKFDINSENLPSIDTWKELVTKNNFSGICMYMDASIVKINDRDVHEFLFCINAEVSMTRSDDNEVVIINCEHEYWKTGKNYKEWILPKSFYTP